MFIFSFFYFAVFSDPAKIVNNTAQLWVRAGFRAQNYQSALNFYVGINLQVCTSPRLTPPVLGEKPLFD